MKKTLSSLVGLASLVLLGCSQVDVAEETSVPAQISVSEEVEPSAEPELTGFFDMGAYSERELEDFNSAYEAMEINFDEFNEEYSNAAVLDDEIVSEVRRNGQAARLQLAFEYGKRKEPQIAAIVTYVGEDWLFMKTLQIRSNDRTLDLSLLDPIRDMAGSNVYELGNSTNMTQEEAEFLHSAALDPEAKVRLVGDSASRFDWQLSSFEKTEIKKALDSFRHVIFVIYPQLEN